MFEYTDFTLKLEFYITQTRRRLESARRRLSQELSLSSHAPHTHIDHTGAADLPSNTQVCNTQYMTAYLSQELGLALLGLTDLLGFV